jgi:hypothetical protein
MSNVLSEEKKQQVPTLERLGWSLPRIEETTMVRRETAGAYLKGAVIAVRGKGGRLVPARPAIPLGCSPTLGGKTGHFDRGVHRL